MKPKLSHIFDRETHEHYVEPEWTSRRLFDVEKFNGTIYDPCCGFGRIVESARAAHYSAHGSDIVIRSKIHSHPIDFFRWKGKADNFVCNPPFNIFEIFAKHALSRPGIKKVAMIWLVARLNAARWIENTPLLHVWLLTPRPSMPPGYTITNGQKPGGGKKDFCWLVWEKSYRGPPELRWLRKEKPFGEPEHAYQTRRPLAKAGNSRARTL